MPTPLRYVPQDAKIWKDTKGRPIAVVEMTIRTILGLFLLKPTTRNTSLILGVLGRAKEQLDFELYGYAYLSNHGSLLLGIRSAQHLARIMEFINGNIARELGRAEQSNWQGRLSSQRAFGFKLGEYGGSQVRLSRSRRSKERRTRSVE